MSNQLDLMYEVQTLSKLVHIMLPTGSTVQVVQKGHVRLNDHLEISEVLYVPSFHYSLISISQLTKETTLAAIFYPDTCLFYDKEISNLMGSGKKVNGLYHFYPTPTKRTCLLSVTNTGKIDKNYAIWHMRWGTHLNKPRLIYIIKVFLYLKHASNHVPFVLLQNSANFLLI